MKVKELVCDICGETRALAQEIEQQVWFCSDCTPRLDENYVRTWFEDVYGGVHPFCQMVWFNGVKQGFVFDSINEHLINPKNPIQAKEDFKKYLDNKGD